jgi:tetratricopeptide (TPR) repeat protein
MTSAEHRDTARQAYEMAVARHREGRLADAETHYRKVHALYPEHPGALHGLGLIALRTQRAEEATGFLERAARVAPSNGAIRSDLGTASLALGRYEAAAAAFAAAVALRPSDTVARLGLGDALSVLGRLDEARAAFEGLLAIDPRHAGAHFGLGNIAMQLADAAAARTCFERAVEIAPKEPKYLRALAETARFETGDGRLAVLEDLVGDASSLTDGGIVELHFALAKAYDDLARYDDAFAQLKAGNSLQRRRIAYDEASVAAFFRDIALAFPSALLRARAGAGDRSDLPVFVVGMPRSGSTLVEQVLASHPGVFGAGELLLLNDLVAELPGYPTSIAALPNSALRTLGTNYVARTRPLAPGARRIVDKLPGNFRHLGLIHLALPNAKIIHVRRDPVDTCFSCYSKLFLGGLNFACDLGELGRYYRLCDGLMAHWRSVLPAHALLEVQYETLVDDFEPEVRRIVAFCGLSWDPRCLDFSKTERPVRTLSQSQVRQPLFASSIGRWRHYEKHLQPLMDALG